MNGETMRPLYSLWLTSPSSITQSTHSTDRQTRTHAQCFSKAFSRIPRQHLETTICAWVNTAEYLFRDSECITPAKWMLPSSSSVSNRVFYYLHPVCLLIVFLSLCISLLSIRYWSTVQRALQMSISVKETLSVLCHIRTAGAIGQRYIWRYIRISCHWGFTQVLINIPLTWENMYSSRLKSECF